MKIDKLPDPDGWSVRVTHETVLSLPQTYGFVIPRLGGLVVPYGISIARDGVPHIDVRNARESDVIDLAEAPDLRLVAAAGPGQELGALATIHLHPDGSPEDRLRVLALGRRRGGLGAAAPEIRYGEPPEDVEGFYLGALEVGHMPVDGDVRDIHVHSDKKAWTYGYYRLRPEGRQEQGDFNPGIVASAQTAGVRDLV